MLGAKNLFILFLVKFVAADLVCRDSSEEYVSQYNLCLKKDISRSMFKNYPTSMTYDFANDDIKDYYVTKNNISENSLDITFLNGKVFTVTCQNGMVVRNLKCTPQFARFFTVNKPKVLCYYSNWATYAQDVQPDEVPSDLCTHIVYSFFPVTDSGEIKLSDNWADIGKKGIEKIMAHRGKGVVEKIIFAVGGWTYSGPDVKPWYGFDDEAAQSNTKPFQQIWHEIIMNKDNMQQNFINSVSQFMSRFKFDGIEIDYEYPACPQGECVSQWSEQKEKFVSFLTNLRSTFGPSFYMSIATGAGYNTMRKGPNLADMAAPVDYISLMTYDYNVYTPGSPSGHNQPKYNVTDSIDYYIQNGVPSQKILLGLALYGRGYKVSDENLITAIRNNVFKDIPTTGGSDWLPVSQQVGTANFKELCKMERCKNGGGTGNNASLSVENNNKPQDIFTKKDCARSFYAGPEDGSWLVYGNTIMSYTDLLDLKRLDELLYGKNLGGYLIYSIEKDDVRGECNLGGTYPIVRSLVNRSNLNKNNLLWVASSEASSTTEVPVTPSSPTCAVCPPTNCP